MGRRARYRNQNPARSSLAFPAAGEYTFEVHQGFFFLPCFGVKASRAGQGGHILGMEFERSLAPFKRAFHLTILKKRTGAEGERSASVGLSMSMRSPDGRLLALQLGIPPFALVAAETGLAAWHFESLPAERRPPFQTTQPSVQFRRRQSKIEQSSNRPRRMRD